MNSLYSLIVLYLLHIFSKEAISETLIPGITSIDYYDIGDRFEVPARSPPKIERWNPFSAREVQKDNLKKNLDISNIKEMDNALEIPEDVFKNIGSVNDLNELQSLLGIQQDLTLFFTTRTRLHSEIDPLSPETRSKKIDRYLDNPKQAHCEPELKAIDLGLINTNSVTYYPTCVKVNQCGGCCPNKNVISCQPVASEKVTVKVLELSTRTNEMVSTQPSRGRRRRNSIKVQYNTINVTVEEHKQCECLCKLREHDCDLSAHIYDEQSCACLCRNTDEEEKCVAKNTHSWKKDTCECLCRHEMSCSSSERFDHNNCTCVSTSIGVSLNNVLLRKTKPLDQIYRQRKPTQALKLEDKLCKDFGFLNFGVGRCKPPVR